MLARIAIPPEEAGPPTAAPEIEPPPPRHLEDDIEEIGRPEGPLEERHIDPYGVAEETTPAARMPGAAQPPPDEEAAAHGDELEVESPPQPPEAGAGRRSAEEEIEAAEPLTGPPARGREEARAPVFGRRGRRRRP